MNSEIAIESASWVRPGDVMKSRKLKAKRQALKLRLSRSLPYSSSEQKTGVSDQDKSVSNLNKRNPFKCLQANGKFRNTLKSTDSENSNDATLFHLFDNPININKNSKSYDFSKVLQQSQGNKISKEQNEEDNSTRKSTSSFLYIDWSLKSRIRFHSIRPFNWKQTFKTSEEASGTTEFVRCLNSDSQAQSSSLTLDTSPNAQFYHCSLFWQHPCLPNIQLFPRDQPKKANSQTGFYGSDEKVITALHTQWSESVRSLYQLVRVRQCPYFYMCAPAFTCLFRAAGTAGFLHSHAIILPTTKGFRDALKKEGVEFVMPLLNRDSELHENETSDIEGEDTVSKANENEDESTDFLEELGLEKSQFPNLNQNKKKSERQRCRGIDGAGDSTVYVEDMDLHALVNFLLNCGSCVATTGPAAGVPATLLAPIAFHGASLQSLKKLNECVVSLAYLFFHLFYVC